MLKLLQNFLPWTCLTILNLSLSCPKRVKTEIWGDITISQYRIYSMRQYFSDNKFSFWRLCVVDVCCACDTDYYDKERRMFTLFTWRPRQSSPWRRTAASPWPPWLTRAAPTWCRHSGQSASAPQPLWPLAVWGHTSIGNLVTTGGWQPCPQNNAFSV